MSDSSDQSVLEVLLDSWERNNAILVNFLRLLPRGGLEARAMESSPSIAQMFNHIHYVRLVFVSEDAPEFARDMPAAEWGTEQDVDRLTKMLNESARMVRDAVQGRIESGRPMDLHYDHPILMLQHMIWHEGYHHGQMKLALKAAGLTMPDEVAGPTTWRVWMRKTSAMFSIKSVELADLDAAVVLFDAQLREHDIITPPADLLGVARAVLANPSVGFLFLATAEGAPVGFVYAAAHLSLEHGGVIGWLEELYVQPDWRGRGIGSRLLTETMARARQLNWRGIELEIVVGHERVVPLYRRHGFEPLWRSRFRHIF